MDITEYAVPVIMAICWCVGYIVKKWLSDPTDKYIPTICGLLGIALNVLMNNGAFTPEILLGGLASGLSATGINEAVKQLSR